MRLSGVRLLLAEDNPTNQLVATQMLVSLGATVTLARDGAEALEILEDHHFDAMLVDIEMPRVSGIDVMRKVRASSGALAQTPMIALTAYVMREHKAAIDAAGADGIIAKPILSIEQLGDDICRFMRQRRSGPPTSAGPGPKEAETLRPPVIDESIYEGLVQSIGRDAMAELLGKVDADIRSANARLSQGLETSDIGEIRSASHILISVAGAIGATPVQKAAKDLNTAAHQGDVERVRDLASGLPGEIDRLLEEVAARSAV
jgi:CheY-like chemotaxis protein